jgi:glycerol-3-phosphate acyltransferase PlsY
MNVFLAFLLAYLLGSIPSAVWLGMWLHGIDVREHGSKNAGATNSFRVLGKRTGIMVLVLDVSKGVLSMMVCMLLLKQTESMIYQMVSAGICVLGHVIPVFAGFRGGKGVATSLGVFLGLNPLTALTCILVFLLVFMATRYVSLSSITAAFLLPFISFFIYHQEAIEVIYFNIILSLIVILAHHKNIKRLIAGEEQRMNFNGSKM